MPVLCHQVVYTYVHTHTHRRRSLALQGLTTLHLSVQCVGQCLNMPIYTYIHVHTASYLLDFHEVELWIAVKPEGHLHKENLIGTRYLVVLKFIFPVHCRVAPHLIEHVELEGESHVLMRVAVPEQLPVKHIALLQKQDNTM